MSDHWYQLLAVLATSMVQVTGVQRGRRRLLRSEDAERVGAFSRSDLEKVASGASADLGNFGDMRKLGILNKNNLRWN